MVICAGPACRATAAARSRSGCSNLAAGTKRKLLLPPQPQQVGAKLGVCQLRPCCCPGSSEHVLPLGAAMLTSDVTDIRRANHTERSLCTLHAGDRRTPPRSKHTVQEFSFKTSAFFGSKINVHASIPRLATEDYVRGKFPKGLPRSAEPAAPAPQPQLPLPGRLDVTPPRGAAPSPPPASPGRLDGSPAIASAPPTKRRAASGRLEAQQPAAELSAEPRPLLGRLVRPPAPAAECSEAPAREQTAAAVEHASSTARSRISIAAPAREALPATPAAVPQLSSEAGATAEPAEAGTAIVRPVTPACGHEAHLASEQVVPVANRAAAAAAAAAVAPRRSRVDAGCQAARESGWRAGSGQATAANVPAPPAPAAAVAESHLDLATLLAAWPSPAGGADVGPAQGAGRPLRRAIAPSPQRPAARPPAVPLLGCGAAQEAGAALPFGEVSNLVSPAAEAPESFQVAQLKAASTGGSRRSGGGSTRSSCGRSCGGKRGSSDSGASDSSGRGGSGSETGASVPPRPRHASASQVRPQALSATVPDISSRSCSSSSMPCDLPPRPSSRGAQPTSLATAATAERNDGSAGSAKQRPQQPAQAPFTPAGQAPADAPGGSQPAHSDSLAQPATPRRPPAKPLAARTPRSGTPSIHSSHRPRPAVSAAALAAVVQLPEMPAAAAGSSVQPFDTKPAASGGFGPPPPPQQHSSPRKMLSPQKRVRPPVAPRPRPSSYAVIAQHRPEPVAAASAGLPPPRQPPQQEAPAAATDGAQPLAGPLEVDSMHHRRSQASLAEPMAPGLSHMPAACSSDAGSASPRSEASAASSERQRPQPDAAPAAAAGYAAKAAAKAAARAAAEAAAQQRRQAAIAARKVAAAAAAAEAERAVADAEALLASAPEEMSYDLAAGTAAEIAAAEPCEPRFSFTLGASTSQPLPKGHYSAVQLLATCGSDAKVAAAAAAASQPVVGEWTSCSVL